MGGVGLGSGMVRRSDREAIHELKFEYHRALDADETEALLAVFTDDAAILHDGAANPLEGIDEYEPWCVDVTAVSRGMPTRFTGCG